VISLGITDADKLYEYFLIDVQMSSCMQSSRIVQATAAIQLFVQRCLLNLEKGDDPRTTRLPWARRRSMRAVGVAQELSRLAGKPQVFLYPENWIDPTRATIALRFSRICKRSCSKEK